MKNLISLVVLFSFSFSFSLSARSQLEHGNLVRAVAESRSSKAAESSRAFDFSALKRLVLNNQVASIEELLPLLPESLRSKYVLIVNSESLQVGTKSSPRVIMFRSEQPLFMAFSGGQNNDQTLEVIEKKENPARFVYHEIDFNGGKPHFLGPNPQKCLECHKNNPRPNFNMYPTWPEALPSGDFRLSSTLAADVEEYHYLKDFINKGASHPRYRYLDRQANFNHNTGSNDNGIEFITTSFELFSEIDDHNSKRVAYLMSQTPAFQKYKYMILAGLYDCWDLHSFAPQNGGLPSWNYYFKDLKDNHWPQVTQAEVDEIGTAIVSNLRYIFEPRGISMKSWFHSFHNQYLMGGLALSVTADYLARDLIALDPDLEVLDVPYSAIFWHYYRNSHAAHLYTPKLRKKFKRFCGKLNGLTRSSVL